MTTTEENEVTEENGSIERAIESGNFDDLAAGVLRDAMAQRDTLLRERDEARISRDSLASREEYLQARVSALTTGRDSLVEERDDLTRQVDRLTEQCSDLRAEHQALEVRFLQRAQALDSFKEDVVRVASEYANRHGWCSTVDQALEELGLQRAPLKYQATLEITVTFSTEMSARGDIPDSSDVHDYLQTSSIRRGIMNNFGLSGDHTGTSVDEIEFEVTDVTALEDD